MNAAPPRMLGELAAIFSCSNAGDPMSAFDSIEALAGHGLAGDRYALGTGEWSKEPAGCNEVTLIEAEALKAIARESGIELAPGAHRRNLVTRGVALNHLVEREFWIGEVRLRGIRLCEPCRYLNTMTGVNIVGALTHRGGLRASVIDGGTLHVGAAITL